MRRWSLIIGLASLMLGCTEDPINQEIISHEGERILVGEVDLAGLSEEPHVYWFDDNYRRYDVDTAALAGTSLEGVEITLFLGTWCSDSQLQVPQFYKILTWLDYDKSNLTMVGLDNHPDRDLQSPQHEEEGLNIEFVPTLIFYREGEELGRIIEFPKASLEKDLARIVGG